MASHAGPKHFLILSAFGSRFNQPNSYLAAILRQAVCTRKRNHSERTKQSGQGPPTAPALRPRVLTPRDHFAHRGGERSRIMQQTD